MTGTEPRGCKVKTYTPLAIYLGTIAFHFQTFFPNTAVIVSCEEVERIASGPMGAFVHKENDFVVLFRRQRLSEYLADFVHRSSLRRMGDDDVLVL